MITNLNRHNERSATIRYSSDNEELEAEIGYTMLHDLPVIISVGLINTSPPTREWGSLLLFLRELTNAIGRDNDRDQGPTPTEKTNQ